MEETPSTTVVESKTTSASPLEEEEEEEDSCRVCRMPASPDRPLYHPCLCRGSIRYVHQDCLTHWLKLRNITSCELCRHPFEFQPIFAPDAPARLSRADLILWILSKLAACLPFLLRVFLVSTSWGLLVPGITCKMFRALFAEDMETIARVIAVQSIVDMLRDAKNGALVCLVIAFISIVFACLREFVHGQDEPVEAPAAAQVPAAPVEVAPAAAVPEGLPPEMLAADLVPDPVAQADAVMEQNGLLENELADAVDAQEEEDMTLSHWLGLRGPISYLGAHVLTVLLYNFLFLNATILLPLNAARFCFWITGIPQVEFAQQVYNFLWNLYEEFTQNAFDLKSSKDVYFQSFNFPDLAVLFTGYVLCFLLLSMYLLVQSFLLTYSLVGGQNGITTALRYFFWYLMLGLKLCFLLSLELVLCPIFLGYCVHFLLSFLQRDDTYDLLSYLMSHVITSLVIHWVFGFAFMFFISLVASVLRKTIRPEVLRLILRDPDDPDFQPLQELLHMPLLQQLRRLGVTCLLYIAFATFGVHMPAKLSVRIVPSLAPLRFNAPTELPSDLLLMQFCLPLMVERLHALSIPLRFTRAWFRIISPIFGLKEYLLPDEGPAAAVQIANNAPPPMPPRFVVRLLGLIFCAWFSNLIVLMVVVAGPVLFGRFLLSTFGSALKDHDIYAMFFGWNVIFLTAFVVVKVSAFVPRIDVSHWREVFLKWAEIGIRIFLVGLMFAVIVPLLIGLVFELSVVMPLRVHADEIPIIFMYQIWAIGVFGLKLWSKIVCSPTFNAPHLKELVEDFQNRNVLQWRLADLFHKIFLPFIEVCGSLLCIPFVLSVHVIPCLVEMSPLSQNTLFRYIFFAQSILYLIIYLISLSSTWMAHLHEKMIEDKYIIGRELRNYNLDSNLGESKEVST